MKKTDCYFYSEFYDMGAHISCCTFKEYPLCKCPCDNCTNYVPQSKVSQIVREYLEHKAIPSAEQKTGHWKIMYEPKNMVVCSKCGKCAYLYNNRGSAYCPHCGNYKGE